MQHFRTGTAASNMSRMDQRSADRFGLALPITLEDAEGETHDLSENGILFETTIEPKVGARISMTIQYGVGGRSHELACQAEVVRVQRVGEKVNVAARLLTPLFSEP
jgi:hypothetical protein